MLQCKGSSDRYGQIEANGVFIYSFVTTVFTVTKEGEWDLYTNSKRAPLLFPTMVTSRVAAATTVTSQAAVATTVNGNQSGVGGYYGN
jgi:hypothetical protein